MDTQENVLHPVHQTTDGYFNTVSGKKISIHDPHPDQIDIEDIAHALAHLCRFGGHTPYFYSVAQHSIMVMKIAELSPLEGGQGGDQGGGYLLTCLMHDAAEAYVHDIIKPLKHILGETYENIEARFEMAIAEKLNIDLSFSYLVKPYDKLALEYEHARFFRRDNEEFNKYNPSGIFDPPNARKAFLHHYNRLKKEVAS